ncbi:MAG: hypothetical protein CMH54_02015 [Myxococcales bacterium]|nr:hypothetical protein [Myxococcales bacterium]|tara:strand:- start:663 stop:1433 length:771 start_codon:yes stop_codon:yes gene_type:complete
MKRPLLLVALVLFFGCVQSDEDRLICEQASKHLSQCFDQSMPIEPYCDVEVAKEVVERPCNELRGAGKADWFGDWLCKLGFLYRCEAPVCEDVPTYDEVSSCSDYIGMDGCASCEYYFCRDAERAESCGEKGYYQGFVGRYCVLFTQETVPRLSPKGQEWIAKVRTCLQESMEDVSDDMSCKEVKDYGYAAHPGCYVDTGFCELSLTDMIAIFNTVSPLEMGLQPFSTAFQCMRQWFNPDTGTLTDEGLERAAYEE